MASAKYYVVWRGRKRGIFDSWGECERQVKGYTGAQYKGFSNRQEAVQAFAGPYASYEGRAASHGRWRTASVKPIVPSVCADAACDGSPGRMEYQGVRTETGERLFHSGPFEDGTNNVGEFLAIVQALRWVRERGLDWPIYSDSRNAIAWVQARKCNTKMQRTRSNARLFAIIAEAEADLRSGLAAPSALGKPQINKWDTDAWGENPADFGRK